MPSEFWRAEKEFHELRHGNYQWGGRGYEAFQYLRSCLEDHWNDSDSYIHPLRFDLMLASELSYRRLIDLELHIRAIQNQDCIEDHLRRLADPSEFLAAFEEMDTFFRLRIDNLSPILIRRENTVTPDIIVESRSQKIWIEVTSIHDAPQETSVVSLMNLRTMIDISLDVMVGGFIVGPFGKGETPGLESRIEEVAWSVRLRGGFETFQMPGRAACFVIDKKKATHIVPEKFRYGFSYWEVGKIPHTRAIVRKIEEKVQKKYSKPEKGFVVLYDRYMDHLELEKILDQQEDPILKCIAENPSILGVALVMPPGFAPNPYLKGDQTSTHRIFRTYANLPSHQMERIIIWQNPRESDINLPIVDALSRYCRNQQKLWTDVSFE